MYEDCVILNFFLTLTFVYPSPIKPLSLCQHISNNWNRKKYGWKGLTHLKHYIFLVCYEECFKRVKFDQILNNLSYLEMNLANECFEGSFFGTFFQLKNYVNKNIRSHIFIIG